MNSKKKIIIFGTGDNAQLAHYYITLEKKYDVVGFTIDQIYIKDDVFMNLPVKAFETIENNFSPDDCLMFIAIGYTQMNHIRSDRFLESKKKGYKFYTYISPRASCYENVDIGENCFILEDNTIQPFVKIGNNVVLWSGNHIGHHSVIGDHCFITSHVVVSGGVNVGDYSFIGVNATLRDHITIGKECVIGAGSIIMHNINDKDVYVPERTKLYKKKSNELEKL